MNIFEAIGLFLGIIVGAVAGSILCHSYGVLAEIVGAVGGGFVGMIVGTLFGYVSFIIYAFIRSVAKIYWELFIGRRKLPSLSSTTKLQRRRLLVFVTMILVVSAVIFAGIYFLGSDEQRSRMPLCAGLVFGTGFIGVLILLAMYHRYPARKEDDEDD
jgi:heme/copper-type cytochrome/quinol oxidase subunit 3